MDRRVRVPVAGSVNPIVERGCHPALELREHLVAPYQPLGVRPRLPGVLIRAQALRDEFLLKGQDLLGQTLTAARQAWP